MLCLGTLDSSLVICNTTSVRSLNVVLVTCKPNLRSREGVGGVSIGGDEVDGEGVRLGGDEEHEGHHHGHGRAVAVRGDARERRDDGAADDAADDPPGAPLGVAAEPAHAEGHNGREADGLEEEHDVEHRHARDAPLRDGRRGKDDAHGQEDEEDPARPHVLHDKDAAEPPDREGGLCAGEILGAHSGLVSRAVFCHVVDEIASSGVSHLQNSSTSLTREKTYLATAI